jgi:hypothetical protein
MLGGKIMLIEIPDDKLPKIMKGVRDLCHEYLEQEDPAPGIGKTENQFFWFEELNSIFYDQVEHETKLVFEHVIDKCFLNIQKSLGITSGDEPFDSKVNELRDNLAKECARVVMFQTY